jgi:DNA polymerase-3 subunit alpha
MTLSKSEKSQVQPPLEPQFVHLRLHSEYSMVDGICKIKPTIETLLQQKSPVIAITDHVNFFGLLKFYSAARQQGIKVIVGVDLWVNEEPPFSAPYRLTLLCMNNVGYLNAKQLLSRAYQENQQSGRPVVALSWLKTCHEGLIVLSGSAHSGIGQALLQNDEQKMNEWSHFWKTYFPNRYYIELQRTQRPNEEAYIHQALLWAEKEHFPVVATNEVCFLKPSDFDAHEVRVCIHQSCVLDDPRRSKNYSQEQYLKSPSNMIDLFKDIPEAIENTIEIAKRCNVIFELGHYALPNYRIPEGLNVEIYFSQLAKEGLEKRLCFLFDPQSVSFNEQRIPYDERLSLELKVINQMGFPSYFLIVADFIQWSKDHQIPVGPGRGSGAGSLAAYALGITDLDPLKYDLLFERFLNPERVSMPDFDIDFCMDGRDQVIDYVVKKYGRDRVSQIITFGRLAAKAVIKDVGRVLSQPYGFVDKISKLIPFEVGMTLAKAWESEPDIRLRYAEEDDFQLLWDMAKKLEGITRNAGKHAGGVVIAPSTLTDFSALYCDMSGDGVVTQFDKDDVEATGLVKFDFLGLRTLTIIDWALDTLNHLPEHQKNPIQIEHINLEEKKVYQLLTSGNTAAIFQLESRGMQELIKKLKPSNFEDIIALVALFRPGPLGSGMVDDFISRKHGKQAVAYPHVDYQHSDLEPILKSTYGIILYQEQVMQIAQVLANFSLGGADLLRRAMGKKKASVMEKQRILFMEGAKNRSIDRELAGSIFDLMEKFAGYGFNKSHSAAYALLSYQTAWLKTFYPAGFMAAVMSADMDNQDKIVLYVSDVKKMGLTLCPPDINQGQYKFTIQDEKTIIYGLGAIKTLGEGAIHSIITHRQSKPYEDLFDFCNRVDLKKINRRNLEALIRSGTLDAFGTQKPQKTRALLMASLNKAMKGAEQFKRNQRLGQVDLFESPSLKPPTIHYLPAFPFSERMLLDGEKEILGFYLTGHPVNQYISEFSSFCPLSLKHLSITRRNESVLVIGLIQKIRSMTNKKGQKWAILHLTDASGHIDIMVYNDLYTHAQEHLLLNQIILAKGPISEDDFSGGLKMTANAIYSLIAYRESKVHYLHMRIDIHQGKKLAHSLIRILTPHKGGKCPVRFECQYENKRVQLVAGGNWSIRPSDDLLNELSQLEGCQSAQWIYTHSTS